MQHKMSADEPNHPTNRPALLDAIDITIRTIEGHVPEDDFRVSPHSSEHSEGDAFNDTRQLRGKPA
jgi:hypothetical protein